MTEPSFAPPRWSMAFLAQVTRGAAAEVSPEPWEPTFAQPASDYLAFRGRLDRDNVSLENVIVREAEQVVVGTVKVRNLAFHKEVSETLSSQPRGTARNAWRRAGRGRACPRLVWNVPLPMGWTGALSLGPLVGPLWAPFGDSAFRAFRRH